MKYHRQEGEREGKREIVPASSRKAPVYACKVDLDGNYNNPNIIKALYAAGLLINTAKASQIVTRLHLLPLLPEINCMQCE